MHTDTATRSTSLHVQFLLLPEAMHGTLHSMLDVLRLAVGLLQLRHGNAPCPLSWEFLTPEGAAPQFPPFLSDALASPAHCPVTPERSLVVVPALYTRNAPHLGDIVTGSKAISLLRRHMAAGGWMASCYDGIAFPAQLGLLDGARIAAPWPYQSWLRTAYPRCDFTGEEPVSLHGRVFSSVAPALQTELMINVLSHLLDPDLARSCASVLLYQPRRQQIAPGLAEQKWLAPTSDSPVYRAIQWMQDHLGEPYRLAVLSRAAATSERTLLRHFRQVLGMTPLDYLHGLRIERAKMLLEVSLHSMHTIADGCGYANAASFRRLFRKVAGMPPGEYRARFRLRAHRARWKVETL